MKKLKIIIKLCLTMLLVFCAFYSILFLCAKYGSKIDRNIPNLKSNAQIISSASKFNYSFCYSNFDIIQIDITRK